MAMNMFALSGKFMKWAGSCGSVAVWFTAALPVTFVAILIHVAAGLAARKST